jgi:putative two-component system response regulator
MSSAHIEALEILLRSEGRTHEAEYKIALTRLSAEIRNRLTQGSSSSTDFIEASVKALSRLRGAVHASLRMECLCDSAQFLYSNGRSTDALAAAVQCEDLAKRTGNQEWISKSQNLQGVLHAELGNIGQAVIQCSKALDIARRTGDLMREVSVINCVGVAMNYGGLYRQAIPCFDRILALRESAEFARESAKAGAMALEYGRSALTNKAQCHFHLEEFAQSFAAIDQCLHESQEPWDSLSSERRAIREFTFVIVALELGKLAAAREHALDCHRYSVAATDRGRFYARAAAALCEVHGGDAESGLTKLENALAKCRSSADRTALLTLLVKSYDQLGRPESALAKLKELLANLRAMRETGLEAIFGLAGPIPRPPASRANDLDALAVREALLRAKVAERRVVTERIEMFERFAIAADLREDESGLHGYRVGKLCALVAQQLQWTVPAVASLELAARLHDIGKIAMPDRILNSSSELRVAERHYMSTHTVVGSELLSKSDLPQLQIAEQIARHHHEWWDGTGYPARLAGKRIPIHARIVALADVFDALTHGRPYSAAWSLDRAIDEIRCRRGTQFDPDLTDCFLETVVALRRDHPDLDAFLGQASRSSPFLQAREKIRAMLEGERRAEKVATESAETVH